MSPKQYRSFINGLARQKFERGLDGPPTFPLTDAQELNPRIRFDFYATVIGLLNRNNGAFPRKMDEPIQGPRNDPRKGPMVSWPTRCFAL